MSTELSLKETKKEWHGSLRAYIIGFFLSLLLTATSFLLVINNVIARDHLIYVLIALATIQAIVQLICFLHLGQEDHPRWETLTFLFMVLVLLIVAIGSLWIMHDLDNRVMSGMNKMMSHD